MREISKFIVHCSDTPDDREVTAADVRYWHVKHRGWSDIGYHYVIRRDGSIEFGRPLERIGAHVKGHNTGSVGVCMIGSTNFTDEQFSALKSLYALFKVTFPDIKPYGHKDFSKVKTCPNFDVRNYLS